jgi:hypothetical protein
MMTFMRTGSFPEKQNDNVATAPAAATTTPNTQTGGFGSVAPEPIPNGYAQPYNESGGPAPMTEGSLQRPQRYY